MGNVIAFFQNHWVEIGVIVLAFNTFVKAVRDAIDKTPQSDDNWFEKLATLLGKVSAYIFTGKRA